MRKHGNYIGLTILLFLTSCGAYFNQPLEKQPARFGEEVYKSEYIKDITPTKPIIVGVYKFRDQTGQYKQVEGGISYSTAVTQGATTILLKALEDSKWFMPIERENVSNLLNERQIIRSTRQEERKKDGGGNEIRPLTPLLFAGVLLEGGIISYDSNIITGGAGARYFGAGASTQYRQDRISIYLRAVSTSSGKILKTVYVSKTILSQAIDINLFRYVKLKRLLEVETGVSQNEPEQLAIKEAIEKAVESLIIEGVKDGIWEAREEKFVVDRAIAAYDHEKEETANTSLYNRQLINRHGKNAIFSAPFLSYFDGDYDNSNIDFGGQIGLKHYFDKSNFNISLSTGLITLSNEKVFSSDFLLTDANLEYTFLPYDKLSPFAYAGAGGLINTDLSKVNSKLQYGLGIEYIPKKNLGFRLFVEQNALFTDELDMKINGNLNDFYWRYGLGISLYLGDFKTNQVKL
jgi:curli production assembly/transport component CsgG